MRRKSLPWWTVLGLLAALATGRLEAPAEAKDCPGDAKVPKEADKVFDGVAAAFRKADAAGVTSFMEPGKDGRLHLTLAGVPSGAYTREQATESLERQYFAERRILSLKPGDGCTDGDETSFVRAYRLTVKVGETESTGTLTIAIARRKVGDETAWFVTSLKDA